MRGRTLVFALVVTALLGLGIGVVWPWLPGNYGTPGNRPTFEPGGGFDWGRLEPRGDLPNLWGDPPARLGDLQLKLATLDRRPSYDHAFVAQYGPEPEDAAVTVEAEYASQWLAYTNAMRRLKDTQYEGDATCGLEESGRPTCMIAGNTGVLILTSAVEMESTALSALTAEMRDALASTADADAPWGGFPPTDRSKSLYTDELPDAIDGHKGQKTDELLMGTDVSRTYMLGGLEMRLNLDRDPSAYRAWVLVMQRPERFGDAVCDTAQPVRCVMAGQQETLGARFYGRVSPEEGARLLQLAYDQI